MAIQEPAPGQMIRDARKHAGYTQEALSEAIGCSKPQLSLMESGQRTISEDRALAIEKALGLADGRIVKAVQWQAAPEQWRQSMTMQQRAKDVGLDVLEEELALVGWFRRLTRNEQEAMRGTFHEDRSPVGHAG